MTSSTDSPPTIFEEFCQLILGVDESIRFVGIATINGAILATKYRTNLVPLLTQEETASSVKHSVWRVESRRVLEEKLGKTLYVIATYEKVKRATIPVGHEGQSILVISFDKDSDADSIIRNKILTLVKPYGAISH
jgi:sugar-specific transcriptional regulator TrmB